MMNYESREFRNELNFKLHVICAKCGYSKVSHELKPIYLKRAVQLGDKETLMKLSKICDNFILGDD